MQMTSIKLWIYSCRASVSQIRTHNNCAFRQCGNHWKNVSDQSKYFVDAKNFQSDGAK